MSRVLIIGTSLGALMGMAMAAMKPDRIAGVVLNDAGPEIDPVGLRRIAGYAGKLPPVSSWTEAAAQAKSVYGLALPGLTDAQWLDFAHRGYRENAAGVPVPDMDPRISEAFKNPRTAPSDLWPLYAKIKGVPMLVIRGALSDLLSAATVARMAREKPDLQQITVANRGHTPLLNEAECLAAIDAFLAEHGQAAQGDKVAVVTGDREPRLVHAVSLGRSHAAARRASSLGSRHRAARPPRLVARSTWASAAMSCIEPYNPQPSPAKQAAPNAVDSVIFGR